MTRQQIAFALNQAESGIPVEEVCRKLDIGNVTIYRKKCGGLGPSELYRLWQLEEENGKLKRLFVHPSLKTKCLDVCKKKL